MVVLEKMSTLVSVGSVPVAWRGDAGARALFQEELARGKITEKYYLGKVIVSVPAAEGLSLWVGAVAWRGASVVA